MVHALQIRALASRLLDIVKNTVLAVTTASSYSLAAVVGRAAEQTRVFVSTERGLATRASVRLVAVMSA